MITDIEDYFSRGCGRCERFATADCSAHVWSDGLAELRRICLSAGLVETLKWGHPCYMHKARNIVILGAFRGEFRQTFFDAALLTDPEGRLLSSGPNTRHKDMLRFTAASEVLAIEALIRAYLAEAMTYADLGIRPARETHDLDLPDELLEVLQDDPELDAAFRGLTPGRQRSYVINLTSAKTRQTRLSRISTLRPKILAGKGATER